MSCGSKKTKRARGGVWTAASTSTVVFVALTPPVRTADYSGFRATVELRASSGDIEVRRGVSYSNDGITWDTAVNFGSSSYVTVAGFDYAGAYTTVTSPSKQFMRLGMQARNAGAASPIVEEMLVSMTAEFKPR